jgi:shikimate dehydrogenase
LSARNESPTFLRLGLIGWPLEHSLSPRLHQAAFHALGLEGEYRLYPIPPLAQGLPELGSLLEGMRSGELRGLNVTMPHKETVAPFLDGGLTASAGAIGAVNTIYAENGRLCGENTDAPGFISGLGGLPGGAPRPGLALILGAGGAARAVVWALARNGWRCLVAARRLAQAQALVDRPGGPYPDRVRALPLTIEALHSAGRVDLVVNATPLGAPPLIDQSPWPEGLALPPKAAVFDLIYHPAETRLVQAARTQGLPACGGQGMLIEQAALSFERWTGLTAPREVMRCAIFENERNLLI